MKRVVIACALVFSASGVSTAWANPVMDALGNVVDSMENVLGPASAPLDNAGEDPSKEDTEGEGANSESPPEDAADHAEDDPFKDIHPLDP